jgi:hypothetical protein
LSGTCFVIQKKGRKSTESFTCYLNGVFLL